MCRSLNDKLAMSLLVPINLAALRVSPADKRANKAQFGKVAADFQILSDPPYLSDRIHFDIGDTVEMEPGIHLHWALPDALTRGEHSDVEIAFRPTPNRFLVVRFSSQQTLTPTADPTVEAWVVESDYQWSAEEWKNLPAGDHRNLSSMPAPLDPTRPETRDQTHAYRGRVVPYADWTEPKAQSNHPPLTAIGYGIGSYAAAYPHCRNVFGFYDPSDDLNGLKMPVPMSLSYLVVGWHSDRDRCDPIPREIARLIKPDQPGKEPTPVTPETVSAAIEANYRWAYDAQDGQPTQTLYVGQLICLEWNPDAEYLNESSGDVKVALAGTVAEALSAVVADEAKTKGMSDTDALHLEWMLNDIQYDLLNEYETPDGVPNLQDALHLRDFTTVAAGHDSAKDSGIIWTIKRRGQGDRPQTPHDDDLHAIAEAIGQPLPPDIAVALNALNVAQSAYDDSVAALAARRGQVFMDWQQWVRTRPGDEKDHIGDYIGEECVWITKCVGGANSLQGIRDGKLAVLTDPKTGLLGDNHPAYKGMYQLEKTVAPRFYQPSDPVILLYGDAVNPSSRYGGDGRFDITGKGNLNCRLSSRITQSIKMDSQEVAGPDLPHLTKLDRFPTSVPELITEAVLLDSRQAFLLAGKLAARTHQPAQDLVQPIQAAQSAYTAPKIAEIVPHVGNGGVSGAGHSVAFNAQAVAPSPVGFIAYKEGEQPWIPLILQWEANYYRFDSDAIVKDAIKNDHYDENWVLNGFRLDANNTEITNNPIPSLANRAYHTYKGMVALAHNAEINLTGQIDKYLQNHTLPDTLKRKLEALSDIRLAMMAQTMGGFHRQLLMREQSLQLPVFSFGIMPEQQKLVDEVRTAAGKEIGTIGQHDRDYYPYTPLRSGMLSISKLRLLDAYGRVRSIDPGGTDFTELSIVLSDRLVGADKKRSDKETHALLPLRIAQPAGLSFRYRSASDNAVEMNSDPASSPVIGWVLFNKIENALVLYNDGGLAIGSFNLHGPCWQRAPGSGQFADWVAASFPPDANPLLRDFALHLGPGAPTNSLADATEFKGFLAAMVDTIDLGAMGITPDAYKQDQGLSLLIGRPLALVRADLRLDLYGSLPAIDQSWEAFKAAVDEYAGNPNESEYNRDVERKRSSMGFANVRFPVRLGDSTRINDGLVGYFIERKRPEETYGTFYAAQAQGTTPYVVNPPEGILSLASAPDEQAKTVIMLVDPRAPVHASTGILPVKSIAIPPAHFAGALKRIAVTFLAAPVLGRAGVSELAVPGEVGYIWSWVATEAAGGSKTPQWTTPRRIGAPNSRAVFTATPRLSEGWLRLDPMPKADPKPIDPS